MKHIIMEATADAIKRARVKKVGLPGSRGSFRKYLRGMELRPLFDAARIHAQAIFNYALQQD